MYNGGSVKYLNNGYEVKNFESELTMRGFLNVSLMRKVEISSVNFERNIILADEVN